MEEKDKWIKNFHDRMEGHSEPVPEGVWKQLEQDLGIPKTIPMWRRWQAVAAIALVLVVSSLTVWVWLSPSADYMGQPPVKMSALPGPVPVVAETDGANLPVAQASPARATAKVVPATPRAACRVAEEAVPEEASEEQVKEENPEVREEAEEAQARQMPEPVGQAAVGKKQNARYAYARSRKKQGRSWSIGLAAGNTPFSATAGYDGYGRFFVPKKGNSFQNDMMASPSEKPEPVFTVLSDFPATAKEYAYNQILLSNLSDEAVNSDVEHKMPVTFGASLRFDLDGKWAVETGVVYTLLSSDLRSGSEKAYYEQEQRLHYVGIPLKLNREVWSNRRLEVYASAGGTVEKCVSGKLQTTYVMGERGKADESEDIKVKPLQWSLSAAAGVQLKLTDKLGIYAEPGVVYYFDDGSEVATIRKEHPFNFNIQLGVRFTLPK